MPPTPTRDWLAAAISVGIDETDELMTDEDTLAGKQHSDLFMNSVHCIGNTSPKCFLTLSGAEVWRLSEGQGHGALKTGV